MDPALITVLTNGGAFGICLVLVVLGLLVPRWVVNDLKEENADLKATVATERERADGAVAAAQSSRDVIAALQTGLRMGLAPAAGNEAGAPGP